MKKYFAIAGMIAAIFISSCKKWDDHTATTTPALNETLMEQIAQKSELSVFAGYLVKTGLDSLLNSSKNFTVFAPDNTAIAAIPANVAADATQLKAWLLNHISGMAYFTRNQSDNLRVTMLNGKRIFFSNNHFGDAALTQSDIYVKNGVLHLIDKVVAPQQSVWEYINAQQSSYAQNAYIASLKYLAQDPALAQLDSINPATGEPVYKPNTGIVTINTFLTKIYDVSNEDSLYTYIVLNNASFASETNAMAPYFGARSTDTTKGNACWSVVKDLVIKGRYTASQLPALLTSRFGAPVSLNAASVVQSQTLSNGIVYIVNASPTTVAARIPTVYVQGEQPISFSSTSSSTLAKVFYRQRTNVLTGLSFNDIYCNLGSSGANFYINYRTNGLYATTYKVYQVALNDKVLSGVGDDAYGTDSTLTQSVNIRYRTNADTLKAVFNQSNTVAPYDYTEKYLGTVSFDNFNWLLSYPLSTPDGTTYDVNPATRYIRLQAPASVTTGIPYNITLDYLKFVPVFN